MKVSILLIALVATVTLFAQGGSGCIVQKYGKQYKHSKKDKKYLENTCNTQMYVFWCHDKNTKGSKKSMCSGDKYYKKAKIFKLGEKKFNQYSIPTDSTVHVGACAPTHFFKGQKSVYKFNMDGSYECAINGIDRTLAKNEVALRCSSGKTKLFKIQGVYGPKKNVLKVRDIQSGTLYTINTRGSKDKDNDIHNMLCKESAPASFKSKLFHKLGSFGRKWCKDNPVECKKSRESVKTAGDLRN